MSEDKINVYEIVKKLVGPIEACGDSNIDRDRQENLDAMGNLVMRLIDDICEVSTSRSRKESSMRKIGINARVYLDMISECIPDE